jgi:hypothetical protein
MSKEIIFNRSNIGNLRKFEEALKILEYSVMFVELFQLTEFNNVIAGQLRLILCDTSFRNKAIMDNSLIKKIINHPKLYPVQDEFIEFEDGKIAFIPGELFDYDKPMINLNSWLKQIILKVKLKDTFHEISIFDFIKDAANKGGGAHVDSSLAEKAFVVDVHAERVLTDIAKGLFRSLGRNFKVNSNQNLSYLIEKIKETAKASE